MKTRRRILKPRPVPAFTVEEAQCTLAGLIPNGGNFANAKIDDEFLDRVRIAFHWATTSPGRWSLMLKRTFYSCRNFAEIDTRTTMGDASFAVGAALAGWVPAEKLDDCGRPWIGMRRAT